MKKSILSSVIGAALACTAASTIAAESMVIRVPIKASLSQYSGIEPVYYPWTDVGSHYGCAAWSPEPSTINFGQNFTQTRDCSQNQKRNVDVRQKDSFSDIIKVVRTDVENRTITETESQPSVGTFRDWKPTTSTFTAWSDKGVDYSFQTWSPVASSQTADFQQSRGYKRDQERHEQKREQDAVTGDIRNVGSPVLHNQTVNRTQQRDVVVAVSAWADVGGHYRCDAWSPLPEDVDVYEKYTQSRDCKQNQTRRWSYDSQGNEIHARVQNQVITETETQAAEGTRRQWISHDSTFTAWTDEGAAHSHQAWSPTALNQTTNFTQTRNYLQPQTRDEQKREIDTISGEIRNVGSLIEHNQDDARVDSRPVSVNWTNWSDTTQSAHTAWSPTNYTETANFTQSRQYSQHQTRDRFYRAGSTELHRAPETRVVANQTENRSIAVSSGAWSNTTRDTYSSWSPAPVAQTSNFTQSRTFTQNQERTWTYKHSATTLDTRLETRGVARQSESRSIAVSWTNWTVKQDDYACGAWTPATNTKAYGEKFTQTRSCKEDQTRNRLYKTGSATVGTQVENQTINVSQSRAATGVGSWTATSSTFTNWVNSGARYDHSSYSPAAGNQTANYTQTRSYRQNQTRNEQRRERDTISGTIRNVGSPIKRTRTVTASESRGVAVTNGGWSNTSASNYTAWSPAAGTQSSNFTQRRTYTQSQKLTYTHKIGSSTVHTRAITRNLTGQSQSRTVTASWSGWVHNNYHSFSGYSPATNTVCAGNRFTQTESFKERQRSTISYNIGGTGPSRYQDVNRTRTRAATGTKDCWVTASTTCGSWTTHGSASWSGYSPAASTQTSNFTQTRSASNGQVRTCQARQRHSETGAYRNVGGSYQQYQASSQSRGVTVSVSGWSNTTRSNYGSWSPAASSQRSNFTQSRSYRQNRTRTWTYRVGSSTIHTRAENGYYNASESRAVSVSWGAWGNYGTRTYGSYSPSQSTVCSGTTLRQTRSVNQPQRRLRYYKVGSSTISSTYEYKTYTYSQSRNVSGTKSCGPVCKYDSNNYIEEIEEELNDYGRDEGRLDEVRWVYNGSTVYRRLYESGRFGNTNIRSGSTSGYSKGAIKFSRRLNDGDHRKWEICR